MRVIIEACRSIVWPASSKARKKQKLPLNSSEAVGNGELVIESQKTKG